MNVKEWFLEHKVYGLVAAFIALGCLYYFIIYQPEASTNQVISKIEKNDVPIEDDKSQNEDKQKQREKVEFIMVDLKGEIKNPGVYQSNQKERVIDVIERAGGLTDKADERQVNFAAHVQDEMVIYIPEKGAINNLPVETANPTASASDNGTSNGKININNADEIKLQNLPGIGPSKAAMIVEYRKENGPFKGVEDLKKISGIGDKTFEKLKDSITVQ